MTNHNSEQKGEGVEYMENVCPSCGFTEEIELPVNANLEQCLHFISSIIRRDKSDGRDLREMWLNAKTEGDGVEYAYAYLANIARELLKELENEK